MRSTAIQYVDCLEAAEQFRLLATQDSSDRTLRLTFERGTLGYWPRVGHEPRCYMPRVFSHACAGSGDG